MPPSSRFIEDVQISINVTRFIIVSKNKMALSYVLKSMWNPWQLTARLSSLFQFVAYRQDPFGSVVTFELVLYDCRLSGIRLRWKDSLTNPTTLLNSLREE